VSNALAIAAATGALRNLLQAGIRRLTGLTGVEVTTEPLDRARAGPDSPRLNLFLYQTALNGAWRNMDIPRRVPPGGPPSPPLALNLYYLLTAYGKEGDPNLLEYRLLGAGMSLLHDHPLLGRSELELLTPPLNTAGLSEQMERLRITPQALSSDEMSKLWTAFATNYRLSTAYEVSVLLIESTRRRRFPLPVLRRGPDGKGVTVVLGAAPVLEDIEPTMLALNRPVRPTPSAQLGDGLMLTGRSLGGDKVRVALTPPRQRREILDPADTDPVLPLLEPARLLLTEDDRILAQLPDPGVPTNPASPAATWPAGFYTASVLTLRADESQERISNKLTFALAPTISVQPQQAAAGTINLTVTCTPLVQPWQQVSLIFGGRDIPAPPRSAPTSVLTFTVAAVPAGSEYVVRLRVDGIDSVPLDRVSAVPAFAADQKVVVP
jgi:Pvc16 N-terminal domain